GEHQTDDDECAEGQPVKRAVGECGPLQCGPGLHHAPPLNRARTASPDSSAFGTNPSVVTMAGILTGANGLNQREGPGSGPLRARVNPHRWSSASRSASSSSARDVPRESGWNG